MKNADCWGGCRKLDAVLGQPLEAIVFDLDGTLLNTVEDIGASCDHVLAKYGYPRHDASAYRKMVGNGFDKLVERAIGGRPSNIAELVREAREYYRDHMMEKTEPYPGMTEALRELARQGHRLAVLSNKPDELSKILINRYFPDIPFEHVVGAIEGVPLKPDPSSLINLLKKMNIDGELAAYCGDSDVDIMTAENAKAIGIGAAWGFRGADELFDAGAIRVYSSPMELTTMNTF